MLNAAVDIASSLVHDMEKLDEENQEVAYQGTTVSLPLHQDLPRVAFLKNQDDSLYSQLAVSAHHSGCRTLMDWRDGDIVFTVIQNKETRDKVNAEVDSLAALHQQLMEGKICNSSTNSVHLEIRASLFVWCYPAWLMRITRILRDIMEISAGRRCVYSKLRAEGTSGETW